MTLVLFAEWRYGRKYGPWGSEDRRQTEALTDKNDDVSPEVEDPKLGGLQSKDAEVFATNTTASHVDVVYDLCRHISAPR